MLMQSRICAGLGSIDNVTSKQLWIAELCAAGSWLPGVLHFWGSTYVLRLEKV
jgi:hypothetical protein